MKSNSNEVCKSFFSNNAEKLNSAFLKCYRSAKIILLHEYFDHPNLAVLKNFGAILKIILAPF